MPESNDKPIFSEIASTGDGRDITRGWLTDDGRLPAQDPILTEFGGRHYDIYKQVLSDWQVRSTFAQRQLALTACEWEVEPGGSKRADKNAAALLEEQLKTVGWDDATQGMHFGVFYGFAVSECLYARDGSTVGLDRIKVRDRARFAYDAKMQLRLLTAKDSWKGEWLPDRKFWQFCTGADHDDDPYGMGLAHWLYWPVQFKRGNLKFWLIAAEKFGSPTAVGWFPPNTSADDRAKLLAALKAIQTESGIRVPEGIRIELLEAQRASGLDYERLCIYLDQAIAKITLGQVMTSEAVGGQYKADVQNSVRQELIKADADLLCESFNRGPARWLTEWNYPGAASPRVFRLTEPEEDLNGRAERESKIFTMGYRPTLAMVEEVYGGEWEEVKTADPSPSDPTTDPTTD
ncbi:MAG TPA: portal protein, partial [Candidatus Competibacteraceae bacterium]|nr:portal protein [Candidatus Competibacteraceae bacterium]